MGIIVIFASQGHIGRKYQEILKYGAVFNLFRLESVGVTHLRTNGALAINNNCAIHFGLKKLTSEKMTTPSKNPGRLKLEIDETMGPRPQTYFRKRIAARKQA